jgi:hypothetical protein
LSREHPAFLSGILLQLKSLHGDVVAADAVRRRWKAQWEEKRALPETLVAKFEQDLKVASTQCLVAVQEASKSVKKLEMVVDSEQASV